MNFSLLERDVSHIKRIRNSINVQPIKIYGDIPKSESNPDGLGCYLNLGGQGCTEINNSFGFARFFNHCHKRLSRSGDILEVIY